MRSLILVFIVNIFLNLNFQTVSLKPHYLNSQIKELKIEGTYDETEISEGEGSVLKISRKGDKKYHFLFQAMSNQMRLEGNVTIFSINSELYADFRIIEFYLNIDVISDGRDMPAEAKKQILGMMDFYDDKHMLIPMKIDENYLKLSMEASQNELSHIFNELKKENPIMTAEGKPLNLIIDTPESINRVLQGISHKEFSKWDLFKKK